MSGETRRDMLKEDIGLVFYSFSNNIKLETARNM